jgi:hypothetical protein
MLLFAFAARCMAADQQRTIQSNPIQFSYAAVWTLLNRVLNPQVISKGGRAQRPCQCQPMQAWGT